MSLGQQEMIHRVPLKFPMAPISSLVGRWALTKRKTSVAQILSPAYTLNIMYTVASRPDPDDASFPAPRPAYITRSQLASSVQLATVRAVVTHTCYRRAMAKYTNRCVNSLKSCSQFGGSCPSLVRVDEGPRPRPRRTALSRSSEILRELFVSFSARLPFMVVYIPPAVDDEVRTSLHGSQRSLHSFASAEELDRRVRSTCSCVTCNYTRLLPCRRPRLRSLLPMPRHLPPLWCVCACVCGCVRERVCMSIVGPPVR